MPPAASPPARRDGAAGPSHSDRTPCCRASDSMAIERFAGLAVHGPRRGRGALPLECGGPITVRWRLWEPGRPGAIGPAARAAPEPGTAPVPGRGRRSADDPRPRARARARPRARRARRRSVGGSTACRASRRSDGPRHRRHAPAPRARDDAQRACAARAHAGRGSVRIRGAGACVGCALPDPPAPGRPEALPSEARVEFVRCARRVRQRCAVNAFARHLRQAACTIRRQEVAHGFHHPHPPEGRPRPDDRS